LTNTIADGSGFTANFTNNITGDRTVRLNGDRTLTTVVFGDSDTSSAGSWLLDNNGVSTNNLILAGTTPGIAVNALGTNKTATISAIIEGTAGLVKSGGGTLTLSGTNTYTGDLTVDGGTLIGTATNNGGAGAFGSFSAARTIRVNGGSILDFGAANMGGGHSATNMNMVITGGTVTNRNANFSSLNNVTLTGGTLTSTSGISAGQAWGAWHINGTVTSTGSSLIEGAATAGRHIRLNANADNTNFDVQSGTLTVSAPLWDGWNTSNTAQRISTLTKLGGGVLVLSGVNAYTGVTTVKAGKLTINSTGDINTGSGVTIGTASTFATSELNFNSSTALTKTVSFASGSTGGTLSGTGTINQAITIPTGNTLSIGNSVGQMNFGSSLGLGGTTVMEIDGGAGAGLTGGHDFANVTGALTYGGALTIDLGATFGVGTYSWDLFNFAGADLGTFSTITLADQYSGSLLDADLNGVWDLTSGSNTWQFTQSTGVLGLAVVPEPRAALLGGLGLLALLRRRR